MPTEPQNQPIVVNPAATPLVGQPQIPGVNPMPNGTFQVQPQVVVKDVANAASSLRKHYLSPAFWTHTILQGLLWLSYFQSSSTSVEDLSLTGSVAALIAYLVHLIKF